MDKGKLHHYWRYLRVFRVWWLVCALVVSLGVTVVALRQNNLKMIELRNNVYRADKENNDIEGALRALREHVHAHMNTNLLSGNNPIKPPIQLKHSHDRAVQAEKERVSTVNEKVYADAQADCERRFPRGLSGSGRVPCVQEYVTAHGAVEKAISTDFYTFDFVSPVWTPDLAGVGLVVSALLGLALIIKLFVDRWIRAVLRDHM